MSGKADASKGLGVSDVNIDRARLDWLGYLEQLPWKITPDAMRWRLISGTSSFGRRGNEDFDELPPLKTASDAFGIPSGFEDARTKNAEGPN